MTVADFIVEIAESFRTGRRRFFLASVTTIFGVFLLVLLIGAGLSVTRGINTMYISSERKYVTINAGKTSMPYKGKGKEVPVTLNDNDIRNLASRFPDEIKNILPIVKNIFPVVVNGKKFQVRTYGVKQGWQDSRFFLSRLYSGRDFCNRDFVAKNKCCIVSEMTAERYFGVSDAESALSRYIEVNGVPFRIIGIFKGWRDDVDTNFILFPATTIMSLWKMEDKYSTIELNINVNAKGLQTQDEETKFLSDMRKLIAHEHQFDYRDKGALVITDFFGSYRQVSSMLGGMRMAILLFCIFILISGIFGVCNILFISVRERTYEIILRRLMGASDANIFALVVCESVAIMSVSSLLGILLAEGALYILDSAIYSIGDGDRGIWGSFVVDFPILIGVVLATIVSGVIAGLAPARRAVRLKITEVH